MSEVKELQEVLSKAIKKEIPYKWGDIKAVGLFGKGKYFYQLKNGARMVYDDLEKFRYALRNDANIPSDKVDAVIDQLTERLSEEDSILQKVADAIRYTSAMMSMRKPLEKIFKKKDIDYSHSPFPHFMIKHGGKKIVIINKQYVTDPEVIVGEYAIGFL